MDDKSSSTSNANRKRRDSPPSHPASSDTGDNHPAKRAKLDDTGIAPPPSDAALTIIHSTKLSILREERTKLLVVNGELANENVRLRKKSADNDRLVAEKDVLQVENTRLERALERESSENEDLSVRLAYLVLDTETLKKTNDQTAENLRAASAEKQQWQQEYQRLSTAYNELCVRAGRDMTAEESTVPGVRRIDLAKGLDRSGDD